MPDEQPSDVADRDVADRDVPSPDRPLAGVRVVSIAVNLPGPWLAWRFTTLGASVTKVEPPTGDPFAVICADWYADLAAGQDIVRLDLKSADDRAELDALLARADLFVTSHRPSALARLGLDPQVVATRHPRLVQVAIVGELGAAAEHPGHDLTYQAAAGVLDPPRLPTVLLSDLAGAERATIEALAGLAYRDRTGQGCVREVALAAGALDFGAPARHGVTRAGGLLGGGLARYGLYATSDGWIAFAALEPHFAQRAETQLGALAGAEGVAAGLTQDAERLAAVFATRSTAEWVGWARDHDIPLEAVR